jgi:hypothetical protein
MWVHTWLVMLSHAVMSVVQAFPSSVMLSLACVFVRGGLPAVEMWFDHVEDRCCDLGKVGMVETVGFFQVMWFLMLESAKDRILGVYTPGQHVPPRVRYETACLLIRYAIDCVVLGWVKMAPIFVSRLCYILCELPEPHGACHTRFLYQNQVLIVCMTQDQLFHTYGQTGSQIAKCHE